jgi:hypothetical protein
VPDGDVVDWWAPGATPDGLLVLTREGKLYALDGSTFEPRSAPEGALRLVDCREGADCLVVTRRGDLSSLTGAPGAASALVHGLVHPESVQVARSPTGELVAVADWARLVVVRKRDGVILTDRRLAKPVKRLLWQGETSLVVIAPDGFVGDLGLASGSESWSRVGTGRGVGLDRLPDGTLVVGLSATIVERGTSGRIDTLLSTDDAVVAFAVWDRWVFAVTADGKFRIVVRTRRGSVRPLFSREVCHSLGAPRLSFSPGERSVTIACDDKLVRVMALRSGTLRSVQPTTLGWQVIGHAGNRVFCLEADGRIVAWTLPPEYASGDLLPTVGEMTSMTVPSAAPELPL